MFAGNAAEGERLPRAHADVIVSDSAPHFREHPRGVVVLAFSDAAAVPSWAKEHVATLVGMEVVGGSNGKLRPSSPVTRAEVAKMLFTLW